MELNGRREAGGGKRQLARLQRGARRAVADHPAPQPSNRQRCIGQGSPRQSRRRHLSRPGLAQACSARSVLRSADNCRNVLAALPGRLSGPAGPLRVSSCAELPNTCETVLLKGGSALHACWMDRWHSLQRWKGCCVHAGLGCHRGAPRCTALHRRRTSTFAPLICCNAAYTRVAEEPKRIRRRRAIGKKSRSQQMEWLYVVRNSGRVSIKEEVFKRRMKGGSFKDAGSSKPQARW